MTIQEEIAQAIERMNKGCSLKENIEESTFDDKEKELYVHACIYYNYNDFENSADRLILLYEDYSKTDPDLFSYSSYSLMKSDVSSSFFRRLCEMHCNIKSEYKQEHLELLNKGIFDYVQNLKLTNRMIPDCIMSMLGDLLDQKIIEKIITYSDPQDVKKYIPSSLDYEKIKGKNIVNCYYNKSSCGIGDFLRGSCYLFDLLNNKNVSFNISLIHHDVGKYIKSTYDIFFEEQSIYDAEKTNKILCSSSNYIQNMKQNLINKLNSSRNNNIHLFSSYSNFIDKNTEISNISITKDCQNFMKSNLIFNHGVVNEAKKIIDQYKLKDFLVLHFRLGDFMLLQDQTSKLNPDDINTKKYNIDFEKIKKTIEDTQKHDDKQIILMSDSNKLKAYVEELGLKEVYVVHNNSQHCSDNPGKLENVIFDEDKKASNMFYVALDMYLMSKSKYIYSYSVYPWGSGFCFWISKIYNIPIESFMIND